MGGCGCGVWVWVWTVGCGGKPEKNEGGLPPRHRGSGSQGIPKGRGGGGGGGEGRWGGPSAETNHEPSGDPGPRREAGKLALARLSGAGTDSPYPQLPLIQVG